MTVLLALTIGCLYGAGVYLMLRRSLFQLVLGLVLLSHGANLLIFTAGMPRTPARAAPPILLADTGAPEPGAADPVPQALILTAIVISFGVLAFALTLFHRTHQVTGSDDPDHLRASDQ